MNDQNALNHHCINKPLCPIYLLFEIYVHVLDCLMADVCGEHLD